MPQRASLACPATPLLHWNVVQVIHAAWAALVLALAGCSTVHKDGPPSRDGVLEPLPADLQRVPDALPMVEPIRMGGPNKPYEVLGETYTPLTRDEALRESGLASWYGRKFHGRRTANGEVYNMYAMTAAHRTMPLPSYARVRNPANGREVIVRVNDRGPFIRGRVIDLSYTAALKLDLLRATAPVELQRITNEEIRSGAWRAATEAVEAISEDDEVAPGPPLAVGAGVALTVTAPATAAAATAPDGPPPVAMQALPSPAATPAARGFWVQLGAFGRHEAAVALQERVSRELEALTPMLAVFSERSLHRLQAGPFATRDDARQMAARLGAALQITPVVLERR